jgi:CYTH domain-containing protein
MSSRAVGTHDPFKYTKFERERRFLVAPQSLPRPPETSFLLNDLYLTHTQLRLRVQTEQPRGEVIYRLTQKLQSPDPRVRRITTLYLTAAEYALFAALPGGRLAKRRHFVQSSGLEWGIDVFEGPLTGLVLAEREFASDAEMSATAAPAFAACEVTGDDLFTGGALAHAEPGAVLARMRDVLAGRAPSRNR